MNSIEKADKFNSIRTAKNHQENQNNYDKAIVNYEKSILKSKSKKETIRITIKLADLYHQGVPDKYDSNGNKIQGIEPDINKALELYQKAVELGYNKALLDIAGIYQWEIGEMFPGDKVEARKKARQIYNALISSNDPAVKNYTKKIAEFRINQMDEADGKLNLNAPLTPAANGNITGFGSLQTYSPLNVFSDTFANFNNPAPIFAPINTYIGRVGTATKKTNKIGEVQNRQFDTETDLHLIGFGVRDLKKAPTKNTIRNDPHNSHDHVVINSIKNAVKKLRNSTEILTDVPTSLQNIRQLIHNSDILKGDKREDAIKALDRIEQSTAPLSYSGESEVDALHLVWNRIHNDVNSKNSKNLRENLLNELAECVEHNKVVCSTGRFNRIMDTLNSVDPEVEIKPQWVINQEMMNKAAKLRKDLESKYSDSEKDAMNAVEPNANQQEICDKLDANFKNNLKSEFKKDYVDSGLMSEQVLQNELNKWIDEI